MSAPPVPAMVRHGTSTGFAKRLGIAGLPDLPTRVLAVAIVGYPVWWLLGFGWLVWPLTAVLMLPTIAVNARKLQLPSGFWLWLILLGGCLLSALELSTLGNLKGWLYHSDGYFAGAVILVYVINLRSPHSVALRCLAGMWCITIAGGVAGILFPGLTFTTLAAHVVPQHGYFGTLTSVKFGVVSGLRGTPRPSAPFVYANRWGAIYATTLPAAALLAIRSGKRWPFYVIGPLALVTAVYSQDRLLWVGLALTALYLLARLARQTGIGGVTAVLIGVVIVGAAVLGSSLHGLASDKFANTASGAARAASYRGVIAGLSSSPLIGHGTTADDGSAVPIGTQGLLWTLLYTGGLLQTVPFYSWFLMVLWKTRQAPSDTAAALRLGLGLGLGLTAAYDIGADGIVLLMICAAALLREEIPDHARLDTWAGARVPDATRGIRARATGSAPAPASVSSARSASAGTAR